MKRLLLTTTLLLVVGATASAQVDVAHRRTLIVQSAFSVSRGEEQINPFGFFWFNEDHYPWTNTALRVIFAGIFADSELGIFLPLDSRTAIGVGLGGGAFSESVTPYVNGERLSNQQFYGDGGNVRVFLDHELAKIPIADLGELPVNVRATYQFRATNYRATGDTIGFVIPEDFFTQTVLAELRVGGIEPGLTSRRGLEVYLLVEGNYRSGFEAFGPVGALFPAHKTYPRAFGSLAGKIPIGRSTVFARVAAGVGDDIDELSAWRLGGNLVNAEAYSQPLHGYYTQEIFAEDFATANVELRHHIVEDHDVTLHLYGDYAAARSVPPQDGQWHSYTGVGAGIGFRTFWDVNVLVNYGYGFNAVRNGDHGGHEVGLAFEKRF